MTRIAAMTGSRGHGRLWPTEFGQPFWPTEFGQTDFGQRWCFSGMADFGQNRLWPNRLWPNRLWPKLRFQLYVKIFVFGS